VQFGILPFTGTANTYNSTYNHDLGTNQYGYELYRTTAIINPDYVPSPGYMTLSNACTTSGCSTTPIYWDENSGVGCHSRGCPSTAFESVVGSIPSEAFFLGNSPEPSSILLFGSGILGLAGILSRKLEI
jgi:hypothetical protein